MLRCALLVAFLLAPAGCGSRGIGGRPGPSAAARASTPAAGPRGAGPVVPIDAAGIRALVTRPGARATLVNVWASWCIPCREEFPALLRVARAHAGGGLRLVLVSADFDDQLPAVHRFLSAQGVGDTSYLQSGDVQAFIDGMDRRWSGALPATFVYDRAGRVTAFWEGAADEARFASAVEAALTSSPGREDPAP